MASGLLPYVLVRGDDLDGLRPAWICCEANELESPLQRQRPATASEPLSGARVAIRTVGNLEPSIAYCSVNAGSAHTSGVSGHLTLVSRIAYGFRGRAVMILDRARLL